MKIKLYKALVALAALLLLVSFGQILMMYRNPMEDVTLDLSLGLEEDVMFIDPENFDSKGWTVYTREGDTVKELTPDGFGGYSGLELGQTIYFSRVMVEELDSPTLQLAPAEWQFSVWLDDDLIYTDSLNLDNRIGHLNLPVNEWFREEPIVISLPTEYWGKTLTIAQSTPPYSETGSVKAWPTSVQLYCGYAYESELISESVSTMLTAALAFLIGAILLIFFVSSRDWSVLCLSLVAFAWMANRLIQTSFFWNYYGTYENSMERIIPMISAGALLVFLTIRAGSRRKLLWIPVGGYLLSIAAFAVAVSVFPVITVGEFLSVFLIEYLPFWLAFGCVAAVLVMGVLFWRKENWFYRVFTPMAIIGVATYWLAAIFFVKQDSVGHQVVATLSSGQIDYIYHHTLPAVAAAAIVTAIAEAVRNDLAHRMEKRLLEQQQVLLRSSYESMRAQHEEVMKLRHDMLSHFEALKGLTNEEQTAAYLDSLIGQNRKIRDIICTSNEMLDIILNSKLTAAVDAGIKVEVLRAAAPEKLPVSDADLCSLVMNMMNNALTAAAQSGREEPYIVLDIHVKDSWLAINCQNSANIHQIEKERKKETVPKHGLGLKIMEGIAAEHNGLFDIEYGKDYYKVSVILPL